MFLILRCLSTCIALMWEYWAGALFTRHTSLSWSMGNNLQVHWHLSALVCLRGRRWCCVPGITYILRRPGRLVRAVSCPPPLLLLPVFPHGFSPPARLTDKQMLSAAHLQLWASITLHKQPIARTQAANFACLSPFR